MAGIQHLERVEDLGLKATKADGLALVGGYHVPGDGGGGTFVWEPECDEAPDGGVFIQGAATAGRWVRQVDSHVSVRWFGATGVRRAVPKERPDAPDPLWERELDAFQRAVSCRIWTWIDRTLQKAVTGGGLQSARPLTVLVPPGWYTLSGPIVLKDGPVVLQGGGPATSSQVSTMIEIAADANGIELVTGKYDVVKRTVDGKTRDVVLPTSHPAGSVVRDLCLRSVPWARSGHGIVMRWKSSIEQCAIRQFAEDGIHIVAYTETDPKDAALSGNANRWRIDAVQVASCKGNGLFVKGSDANAGVATNLDLNDNGKAGVLDESFLGNTYVAPHAANSGSGDDYAAGGGANQTAVVVNPYSEGYRRAALQLGWLVLGGTATVTSGGHLRDGRLGIETTRPVASLGQLPIPGFAKEPLPEGATPERVVIDGSAGGGTRSTAWEARKRQVYKVGKEVKDRYVGYGFAYEPTSGGGSFPRWDGWWELHLRGTEIPPGFQLYGTPFAVCTPQSAAASEKIAGRMKAWLPHGFFLGSVDPNSPGTYQTSFGVPPNEAKPGLGFAEGTWNRGDIVFNSNPGRLSDPSDAKSRVAGWICVEGGVGGKWAEFGRY